MRIHYLQHVVFEHPGYIADWAIANHHSLTATKFFEKNYTLPPVQQFDILIVMGGPMGVYDQQEHSWLHDEKRFIKETIDKGKAVLGVCLGSQLIAEVLGAKVFPNDRKEIGFYSIEKVLQASDNELNAILPEALPVFHWHGDTFHLPKGAVHLYSSQACVNQAFVYNNNVLGLQFHLEVNDVLLQEMVNAGASELVSADFVQTREKILQNTSYLAACHVVMSGVLGYLCKTVRQ